MNNTREFAVNALLDILQDGGYNNITLKRIFLKNQNLTNMEKAFITELVNGTLRNIIYIDYVINSFSKTKTKKIKPIILNILRISVYQILFMEKVHSGAICNEAVNLVKKKRFNGLAGFVNGLLRNIERNKNNIKLPDEEKEPIKFLAIRYSYPEWIIKYWLLELDYKTVKEICKANSLPPNISICINTNKINKEQLKKLFDKENIKFEDGKISNNSLYIFKTRDISKMESFKKGYFHIMDESSMLVPEILNCESGSTIIDVCSAPGGKSFYLSYLMKNEGKIFSRDIYEHKLQLIEEAKERLDVKIIETQNLDATTLNKKDFEKADTIIVDAPCSGFGILKRKADIKYNKIEEDINSLVEIQRNILTVCSNYVKKGGILLYSTCTISKKENIENMNWFLQNFDYELEPIVLNEKINIDTAKDGYIQILPHMFGTDGFFIAKFKRKF